MLLFSLAHPSSLETVLKTILINWIAHKGIVSRKSKEKKIPDKLFVRTENKLESKTCDGQNQSFQTLEGSSVKTVCFILEDDCWANEAKQQHCGKKSILEIRFALPKKIPL